MTPLPAVTAAPVLALTVLRAPRLSVPSDKRRTFRRRSRHAPEARLKMKRPLNAIPLCM